MSGLVLILVLGSFLLGSSTVNGGRRADRRSTTPIPPVTDAPSEEVQPTITPSSVSSTEEYNSSRGPFRVGPRFGTKERYKSRLFATPSPRDCGSVCPEISSPVCAGDVVTPPQTFSNSCQLDRYNCRKRKNLEVIQDGACDHPDEAPQRNIASPRPTKKTKFDDRRTRLVVSP